MNFRGPLYFAIPPQVRKRMPWLRLCGRCHKGGYPIPEWNVVLWVGGVLLVFFAVLILAEAIYWRSLKKKQDAQKSPDPSAEQRGENEH